MLKKILHVDDDQDIREIARIALEDIGDFDLRQCSSGPQALEEGAAFHPDIIVLDLMMPGMSGETTYRKMRECSAFDDVPVVFVTAKAEKESIGRLMALGAKGVIQKPFDPLTLADEIRAICDTSR